ncbi:MAG TPA: ribonuclease P protein component [Streptosporangiaceae bacterium]|nr:ribonuclease P protein component [Streptosporangiaceae bacterium]
MLPKAARMRRRTDFTDAIKGGSRYGRSLVVGHLITRMGCDEPPKIGFIVSRAVGQAVVRNKVRRRLRHLMAGYLHSLPRGSLLVLRANPRAATARQAELAAELDVVVNALLRRQGCLRHGGAV